MSTNFRSLDLSPDGGTSTRSYMLMSERSGVLTYETRDTDRASLAAQMTLSSVELKSDATKVQGKLILPVLQTVDGIETKVGQNQANFSFVLSDTSTLADRSALRESFLSVLGLLVDQIDKQYPINP